MNAQTAFLHLTTVMTTIIHQLIVTWNSLNGVCLLKLACRWVTVVYSSWTAQRTVCIRLLMCSVNECVT